VEVDASRRSTGIESTQDLDQTGHGIEGAKCRNGAGPERAQNPERRGMPNGAESQTAASGGAVPLFVALRDSAPFGIPRCLGFRAVWDSAPSGIPRRSGFRAVRHSALFGPCAVLGTWRLIAMSVLIEILR